MWWEDEGCFEWPPPELFGGGFFGGGELFLVGGGDVVLVGGGEVVVGVVLVVLGQVSLMLTTPAGSFNVDGGTPGGRWK